ncbi:MAG TPA: hypothetical protein VFV49_05220, partial [Thermoanaerobaculia bacterium]|nr:hypothetical protein [Thermoanaerobaculia bacterium]
MKEQTRRNLLRYGIAIDLVILATGVGMLVPPTPSILIFTYAAAVALSVWRGGWQGGLTALLLSIAAWLGVFPQVATASNFATLFAASVVGSALVMWATRTRTAVEPEVGERATGPIAVPALTADAADDFAQQPLERSTLAEVVPLESRAEAERIRQQEREAVERELQERLAAERRALEEQAERVRAEAEAERVRLENELREQREAQERVEAARRAAEEEATRQRLEAERAAAEAERAAAEAQRVAAAAEAERQRVEAERVATEAEAERQRAARESQRLENEL